MKRHLAGGWLLALAAMTAGADERVVWDKSTGDVFRRAVVVDEHNFNSTYFSTVARRLLEEHSGKRFVQLQLFTQEEQANPFPRMSHLKFEGWLHFYQMLSNVPWRVAELTAFGGNAVLRIRDGDSVTRILLEGTDPLQVFVGDASFEILHIAFVQVAWAQEFHAVRVYVRSQQEAPTSLVKELFEKLRLVLHPKTKAVVVRRDHWFITDEVFPIYYWFERGPPPPKEKWGKTRTLTCADYNRGIECY